MSVRASTALPRACSGDIYWTVPMMVPGSVDLLRQCCRFWHRSRAVVFSVNSLARNPTPSRCHRDGSSRFGFDVTMDDAGLMRGRECRSHLHNGVQHLTKLHSRVLNVVSQSFAFDKLSNNVMLAVVSAIS